MNRFVSDTSRLVFLALLAAAMKLTAANADSFKIETKVDSNNVTYTVDNRTIANIDVHNYQDNQEPGPILIGNQSAAITLGRDKDMLMISGFKREGNNICTKTLMIRLRDGTGIRTEHLGSQGGRELYGVSYGRKGDLYNVYGVRVDDFTFVFDPRAPRTGRSRNANTPVPNSSTHEILNSGCR